MIIYNNFLEIPINVAHTSFLLEFLCGLKINVVQVNSQNENKRGCSKNYSHRNNDTMRCSSHTST